MTAHEPDEHPVAHSELATDSDCSNTPTTAEKKPAASRRQLGLLGLVIACGAGVAFVSLKNNPQSADAAPPRGQGASSEISDFVAHDAGSITRMKEAIAAAERMGEPSRLRPQLTQVPVTDLRTNPFHAQVPGMRAVEVPDDSSESRKTEQERQATLAAVQSLQLQSILRGDSHRACLINGTLYQEGQEVGGFVVEEIAVNSVVVRKGIYRFELKRK